MLATQCSRLALVKLAALAAVVALPGCRPSADNSEAPSSQAAPLLREIPGDDRESAPEAHQPTQEAAHSWNRAPTVQQVAQLPLPSATPDGSANVPAASPSLPEIDERRLNAAGVRKIAGQHLTLYTDLPSQADVDELPSVFDLAIPQWCEYFEIDPQRVAQWHVVGYLMERKEAFEALGLLPPDLPPFLHGFHRGNQLWLYQQPSPYYRRHLLLHEGTHAFMFHALGAAGPPWYMEGVAELLATHRWQEGQLTLRHFPQSREETPHWGRIKVIKDDYQAGRAMPLTDIMRYDDRAHLQVEPYAWCWAAAAFFDFHPQFQAPFRLQKQFVQDQGINFSRRFYELLEEHWMEITEQWQLFVVEMDYGYDIPRSIIQRRPSSPLEGPQTITVTADHGWQSTGIRLEAHVPYQITAQGRYQIGQDEQIWWCEPGGVTIRYNQGHPLGMLMGAVRDEQKPLEALTPLAKPVPLGLHNQLVPTRSGTLYLRVNESPADLEDNAGKVQVEVRRAQP